VADQHHAADELGYLSGLPSPAALHEQAVLESAAAAARARLAEVELALAAARQDLAEASPAVTAESPAPSDPPFVGAYRTNFDAIFAKRTPPTGLKRIDRTLPVFLRLIEARAVAVGKEQQALLALTDAFQRGQAGLPQLLESFLQLRQQRIAFLASVRDYNYSIADYAVSVTTPDLGRDAVVSMLIETRDPKAGKSPGAPVRAVQPAADRQAADRQTSTAKSVAAAPAVQTDVPASSAPATLHSADVPPTLAYPPATGSLGTPTPAVPAAQPAPPAGATPAPPASLDRSVLPQKSLPSLLR
jgi:hypothetical protein